MTNEKCQMENGKSFVRSGITLISSMCSISGGSVVTRSLPSVALILLFLSRLTTFSQAVADPSLLAEINQIKAIDNHAHPLRYVGEGEKPDDEFDALPLDVIEPSIPPLRILPTNPEFIGAWKTLYGYNYDDMSSQHVQELLALKKRVLGEQGQNFPVWVLDRLNIETMFANRIAMGSGLRVPRFRWVSFVDALLFPLRIETAPPFIQRKSNC